MVCILFFRKSLTRSRRSGTAATSVQPGITMYPVVFLLWCTLSHSSGGPGTSLFHIMISMSAKRHASSSQSSRVTKIYLTCVTWSRQRWALLFPRTYWKLKRFTWQFGRLFVPSSLTEQPGKLHKWQSKWLKKPSRQDLKYSAFDNLSGKDFHPKIVVWF